MQKKIAIMQPYFLPYIGYWQLISAVDTFVVYDNIEFSKGGWVHRNRFLAGDKDVLFSLPLKQSSDFLNIKDRYLSDDFHTYRDKIFRRVREAYNKAPYRDEGLFLLEKCLYFDNKNLFEYIYHSIGVTCSFLDIKNNILVSSEIPADHSLKKADRVISICKTLEGTCYINPIGGLSMYDQDQFNAQGISLFFQRVRENQYDQKIKTFVPRLSVIDMIMFTGRKYVKDVLGEMDLISGK